MSAGSGRPVVGRRPGRLVIVGSGIKAIAQFTLEAEAHVRWADVVYYNVTDPVTARWIVERSARAVDLYELYDDDKPRMTTYLQMAELMLESVRRGCDVVGVFYGHPGVFVQASHRAISLARREGYAATMLPAVSAIDCLFADLGVDPCEPGCQIVGATDLLLRRRPLLSEGNVVVLQVGVVGDLGFQGRGYSNSRLSLLVRYLQDEYGEEHPVVHYIAAEYPTVEPTMERLTLAQLHGADARRRVTEASTFYLPPKRLRPTDQEMAGALGLSAAELVAYETHALDPSRTPRSETEVDATAELEDHRSPPGHSGSRPSPALAGLLEDLALDPGLLVRYDADPESVLASRPGLSAVERAAASSGDARWLHVVLRSAEVDVARRFVRGALSDLDTARRYHDLLRAGAHGTAEAEVVRGLRDLGYDTSAAEISQALGELTRQELGVWACRYELVVDGRRRGALTVTPSAVLLDGAPVTGHRFEGGVLSWGDAPGNESSAVLTFFLLTEVDGGPLPPGAYLGPQLRGVLWPRGAPRPDGENAFGKVGVYSAASIVDPVGTDPPEAWEGDYVTYLSTPHGRWTPGPAICVRPAAGDAAVELLVAGHSVDDRSYSAGMLSWVLAEPAWSGAILFYRHGRGDEARLVGRLWQGQGQRSPAMNCVGREAAGRG